MKNYLTISRARDAYTLTSKYKDGSRYIIIALTLGYLYGGRYYMTLADALADVRRDRERSRVL